MKERLTGSYEGAEASSNQARGKLRALLAASGLALAASAAQADEAKAHIEDLEPAKAAEAIPGMVDRDLLAAIRDAISDNPQIRGMCQGVAFTAGVVNPGEFGVAYPINAETSEADLKTAIQACLDWDYAKGDDPEQLDSLLVPLRVVEVEIQDDQLRVVVESAIEGSRAAFSEAVWNELFSAKSADAAMPAPVSDAPQMTSVPVRRPEQADEVSANPLAALLGAEKAETIMAELQICLAEYNEVAAELREMDEAEEAAETVALGEEDCGDIQQADVRIALGEQRLALATERREALLARQAAADMRVAELQADTAETLANIDRLRDESSGIKADVAELREINTELAQLTIDRAICQAQGKSDAECGAMDARINELQALGMAILEGKTEDALIDDRTASLAEKDA